MTDQKKPDPKKFSEKDRIDAMDAEKFPTKEYHKDGQGGPAKVLGDSLGEEE